MRRAKLDWFRLGFPRDLGEDAVLAALASFSGLPHPTRLTFDLSATAEGIAHHLAVSPQAAETVLGSLRAAIPSLRLDEVKPSTRRYIRALLWQVSPSTAVIRSDGLTAIAAALLASLFPLHEQETVWLSWTMRPHLRPPLPLTPEIQRNRQQGALLTKLSLPGLNGYGVLGVGAKTARNWEVGLHFVAAPSPILEKIGMRVAHS